MRTMYIWRPSAFVSYVPYKPRHTANEIERERDPRDDGERDGRSASKERKKTVAGRGEREGFCGGKGRRRAGDHQKCKWP